MDSNACVCYIILLSYRGFVWIDQNIYQGIAQFFIEFGVQFPCVLIILLQRQGYLPMAVCGPQ